MKDIEDRSHTNPYPRWLDKADREEARAERDYQIEQEDWRRGKMKYEEAVHELKHLAGEFDWCLKHETTSYLGVQIHGYIAAPQWGHADTATTYAEAIVNVKRMMGLIPCDPAPEDEFAGVQK